MKSIKNKRFVLVSTIVIVLLVSLGELAMTIKEKGPFETEITEIVITQEVEPYRTAIEDEHIFIENMKVDEWKETKEFNYKSEPIFSLKLNPSGDIIDIYDADDDCAYAGFNEHYYTIPSEVFDYIKMHVNSNATE